MPRALKKAGTFQRNAWTKHFTLANGERQRIYVHCRDLGLPEEDWTEARSYQAAIAHWEKLAEGKKENIDRQVSGIANLHVELAIDRAKEILNRAQQESILSNGVLSNGELNANRPDYKEKVDGAFDAAKAKLEMVPTVTEKSLSHWKKLWLEDVLLDLRPKPYANLLSLVKRWDECSLLAPAMDVTSIGWETVRAFRHWVDKLGVSFTSL